MRIIVFFDLPTITLENRIEYRRFRKFLLKEGFMMMQESVYCKLLLNTTTLNILKRKLIRNKPKSGLVQILSITEKQYQSIDFIVGSHDSKIIDSDEGVIII